MASSPPIAICFITFLISGIWHGAAWTFAIWGMLHALGVMLTRELERSAFLPRARPRDLSSRPGSSPTSASPGSSSAPLPLEDALLIVRRIFSAAWGSPHLPALMIALVAAVWLYQYVYESRLRPLLRFGFVRVALAVCMMLYLCLCSSGGGTFIYFQF